MNSPLALASDLWRRLSDVFRFRRLMRKYRDAPWGTTIGFRGRKVRITDGPNFAVMAKDIFFRRIYHFDTDNPVPYVLDCGSNIGMSLLYFKQEYPRCRVAAFEPDPEIFALLQDNIPEEFKADVAAVNAAVAAASGKRLFSSDRSAGGSLCAAAAGDQAQAGTGCEVECFRLRDYLDQPVDYLKMNIEGAEYEVLADCEDRLRNVRQLVIEYHHLPGLPRTLHEILSILHRQGFEYLINDFDSFTNPSVNPPFRLQPETRYYLLIYARRTHEDAD